MFLLFQYQYEYEVKEQEKELFFDKNEAGDASGKVSNSIMIHIIRQLYMFR